MLTVADALGDLAPFAQGVPGLPALTPAEQVTCGTGGVRACTREGA